MSFSSEAKDEIGKLRIRDAAQKRAVLCALTHTAGSLTLGRKGVGLQYVSENYSVAKLIASLAASLYSIRPSIAVREQEGLRTRSCIVELSGECGALFADAGYGDGTTFALGSIPALYIENESLARYFLRGAFLGAGSVTDPKKRYHLEIVCRQEPFAQELCAMLNREGINAKVTERKASYIVYVKVADMIADLLRLLGASQSTLEFEHARVLRSVSNRLNRQRNFEDFNMQKTADACAKQLVDIQRIQQQTPLQGLPPKLYAAAEARLNYPEASLAELAAILDTSKSALSRRFTQIAEMAELLRAGSQI